MSTTKPKKIYKKKVYKRKSNKPNILKKEVIPWYNPQPNCAWAKVRYCDSTTLTSVSGAIATRQYNISSLYDPDYTNVGHQPYTFDQLSPLFNAYCVKSVVIKFKAIACTLPLRVNVYPRYNNSGATSSMDLGQEYKYSSNFMVGTEPTSHTFKYDLCTISGSSWEQLKKDGQSTMNASPAASTYWNISVKTADLTSSATIAYDLEIDYVFLVSQDLMQAQS